MDALQKDRRYTYADYLTWPDDVRYELIDGIPYMTAAPSRIHQEILVELSGQLRDFLKGKPCKLFVAPFDVRLNADSGDDNVVQPDLLVVCDRSKLDDKGCTGAPDMIIEILSQSTARYDRVLKFNTYRHAGVREYWIVDPDSKTVTAHILKGGDYATRAYGDTDTAPVHVLQGCEINLTDVFGV
jgi:Uma2 family endonuclease